MSFPAYMREKKFFAFDPRAAVNCGRVFHHLTQQLDPGVKVTRTKTLERG